MREGAIERLEPLVEELAALYRGHLRRDGGLAARRMQARVRDLWPDVAEVRISQDPDPEDDVEVLGARIAIDVGEIARRLTEPGENEALGWSRANLLIDLERYLTAIGRT